jgi:hypothetical protein
MELICYDSWSFNILISFVFFTQGTHTMTLSRCLAEVHWQNVAERTHLKKNGRAIWLAVAGVLIDEADIYSFLPAELERDNETFGPLTFDSADAYFAFLMSDGKGEYQLKSEDRIADINPDMLVAKGMRPAGNPDQVPEANVWHVVVASDSKTPFLITRNVKASDIRYPIKKELDEQSATRLGLKEDVKPFGTERAIVVTLNGCVFDFKAKQLTRTQVCPVLKPEGAPELKVLPAKGGYF